MLADIARSEIWDNGNNNAWAVALQALFEANGIDSVADEKKSANPLDKGFAGEEPDGDPHPLFFCQCASSMFFFGI